MVQKGKSCDVRTICIVGKGTAIKAAIMLLILLCIFTAISVGCCCGECSETTTDDRLIHIHTANYMVETRGYGAYVVDNYTIINGIITFDKHVYCDGFNGCTDLVENHTLSFSEFSIKPNYLKRD